MSSMQDAFRKMVVADVIGEATTEERAYLRSDDNLAAWKEELNAYLNDLYAESKRRQAAYHRLRNQTDNWAEINDFAAESLAFGAKVDELKVVIYRRLAEAKRLEKDLRRRRHEEHQRRSGARQEAHTAQLDAERQRYRAALYDAKNFLELGACFKEEFLPLRDEMLAKLDAVLAGPVEGGDDGQDLDRRGPEEAA